MSILFDHLERLNEFINLCEQRPPTVAECCNARSDVLAAKSLTLRYIEHIQNLTANQVKEGDDASLKSE